MEENQKTLEGSGAHDISHRSEKQIAATNDAAAMNDPKESKRKFLNKKGSPKNPRCSLSASFMTSCSRSGRR